MIRRLVAASAAALVLAPLVAASPAQAQADPGVVSSYDFSFALYGSHYFGVVDRPEVTLQFSPTAGGDQRVTVSIQEARCAPKKNHCTKWKTVAKDKHVFLRAGQDVTLVFSVPVSDHDHRITMTKKENGVYYQGGVTIS